MKIQWDKSLYTKINEATQAEVDRVNEIVRARFPAEYENEWGTKTTLRRKMVYLTQLTGVPDVKFYAQNYVDLLNGPANGWGQHVCPTTDRASHEVYRAGIVHFGEQIFNDALKAIWKEHRT